MWRPRSLSSRVFLRYIRGVGHPGKLRLVGHIAKLFREGIPLAADNGARMAVEAGDFIGWAILNSGAYEPRTLERAATILATGGCFVDAGANVGLFTVYLGVLPGVTGVSIEPHPANFSRLQRNIRLNGLRNVTCSHVALSDRNELLDLEEIYPRNSGTVRVYSADVHSTNDTIMVAAHPLEHVLRHAGVGSITLLKVDVEGFELRVLEGLDWQGKYRPQNVLIEFTDYTARFDGSGRESLMRFFADRGYTAHTVDGAPLSHTDTPIEDNAWFRERA